MAKRRRSKKRGVLTAYFRQQFREHPEWLEATSNDAILEQYQSDHPGKEVDNKVRQRLANLKSTIRKKGFASLEESARSSRAKSSSPNLEALEEQIDECLTLAKNLDREGLKSVIHSLRLARNAVVVKTAL